MDGRKKEEKKRLTDTVNLKRKREKKNLLDKKVRVKKIKKISRIRKEM